MAIIKCPECGHQVSDKAPTCPSCGVEIAGKVVRCHQCGAIYFSEHDACPICSYPNTRQKRENTANATPPPIPPTKKPAENEAPQPKPEPPQNKPQPGGDTTPPAPTTPKERKVKSILPKGKKSVADYKEWLADQLLFVNKCDATDILNFDE